MDRAGLKKLAILLGISLLASVAIIRTNTIDNVPFCVHSAGCHFGMEPRGKVTTKQYGFPATYKVTETFNPVNNDEKSPKYAGYAGATAEQQKFNPLFILINTLFWFGVLRLLSRSLKFGKQPPINEPASRPAA